MGGVNIRKFLCAVMTCVILFGTLSVCGSFAVPSVSAEKYVLINALSGEIICGRNYDKKSGMASTTKIMTAIVAIENSDINRVVTVSAEASGVEGSSAYLQSGEKLKMIDLIYSLMLSSANDAAVAIAMSVSDSVENFVALMNEKAQNLELHSTHFENPHGLDGEEHYTTAYELALLTAYAMKNEIFREIVSTKSYTYSSDSVTRTASNHNRMLSCYDYAVGVKTGFTKACGRCLVSAAEKDGLELIAVTLNAPDDWHDHMQMLDFGFETSKKISLAKSGEITYSINIINGTKSSISCSNKDYCEVYIAFEGPVRVEIELSRFYYAPVYTGDVVGRVVFYSGDTEVGSVPLYACENSENIIYKKTFKERIIEFFGKD